MDAHSTEDGRETAFDATPEKGSGPRRLSFVRRALKGRRQAELITDADTAPGDNRRKREVVYSILQFLRIPALLIAFYLMYTHHWVSAAVICAVTIPLPWIAVVIANETREKKDPRVRNVYKPALVRAQRSGGDALALGAGSPAAPSARRALDSGPDTIDHDDDASSDDAPPGDAPSFN